MECGGRGFSWVVSEGGGKSGESTVVVWRCMTGGGRVGIRVSVLEGSCGKWGELGRERELLRLLVLLVRRVGGRDVENVVAILLLLVRLAVRGSFGCVRGVSRAFMRLVLMRMRVVLVG
jgi:hypothetical protein